MSDDRNIKKTETDPLETQSQSVARKSVTDALRASFRLLSVLMVLALIGFFATGVASIKQGEQGLIMVNGKYHRTVGPGIAFTFPFPFGEIIKVSTENRSMEIIDFEVELPPAFIGKDMDKVNWPYEELRPGIDGALLTGNRGLYHVKIIVNWTVADGQALAFKSVLADPEKTLRGTVCRAATHAAASMTSRQIEAFGRKQIAGQASDGFAKMIKIAASKELDELKCGIVIESILIPLRHWPYQTKGAFQQSQDAETIMETTISSARAEAGKLLLQTAGVAYSELVGDPAREGYGDSAGLIGMYERAMESADEEKANEYLAKIDKVLLSGKLSGQAKAIILQANADRSVMEEGMRQRSARFVRLLDSFSNSGLAVRDILIRNLLAETKKRVMDNADVIYIIPTTGKHPFTYTLPNIKPGASKPVGGGK